MPGADVVAMAARPVSTRRLAAVGSGVLLTAAAAGGLALPAAAHDHSHQHGTATTAPAPTTTPSPTVTPEGHDHQHAPAATPVDRPRAAVLGGFAAVNGIVLAGAFVARRRGLAGHPPRVRRG
jgi:hypothetical protein